MGAAAAESTMIVMGEVTRSELIVARVAAVCDQPHQESLQQRPGVLVQVAVHSGLELPVLLGH